MLVVRLLLFQNCSMMLNHYRGDGMQRKSHRPLEPQIYLLCYKFAPRPQLLVLIAVFPAGCQVGSVPRCLIRASPLSLGVATPEVNSILAENLISNSPSQST